MSWCFPFIFRGALDVRDDDQRGDEARLCARDRRPRDGRAVRYRRARVQHREPALRPGIPDTEALRPAPHRDDRARRGQGGDGVRRRHATDRRLERVQGKADAVRVPLGPADEADLHCGQEGPEAHRVRRRRRGARAARGAGGGGRRARAAHPRGPARSARTAHRAVWVKTHAGQGLRDHQSRAGRPLPRLLAGLLSAHRAPWRIAGLCADRDAPPPHADRRDGHPPRRR